MIKLLTGYIHGVQLGVLSRRSAVGLSVFTSPRRCHGLYSQPPGSLFSSEIMHGVCYCYVITSALSVAWVREIETRGCIAVEEERLFRDAVYRAEDVTD